MNAEARLRALEKRNDPEGAAIVCVASAADAGRVVAQTRAEGRPDPLCIVTNGDTGRGIVAAGTVDTLMRDIAERGYHICDRTRPPVAKPDWTVWRPYA